MYYKGIPPDLVTVSYKCIKSTTFGTFGPIVGKWVW